MHSEMVAGIAGTHKLYMSIGDVRKFEVGSGGDLLPAMSAVLVDELFNGARARARAWRHGERPDCEVWRLSGTGSVEPGPMQ